MPGNEVHLEAGCWGGGEAVIGCRTGISTWQLGERRTSGVWLGTAGRATSERCTSHECKHASSSARTISPVRETLIGQKSPSFQILLVVHSN